MDLISSFPFPLVGVCIFGLGIRHLRSPSITADRFVNVVLAFLPGIGLTESFQTLAESTPQQLLMFLCGFLGVVGGGLSLSTMYTDRNPDSIPITKEQRLQPQAPEA
jgi:hypothetical protein